MDTSVLLDWIFGGGLLAALTALVTVVPTVRKSRAEAERARADAEAVRIDNAEHATRILMENIVKPLKNEFNETKEELSETKKELARNTREMAHLRKALDGANGCEHRDGCPVLDQLREQPKERDRERGGTDRGKRQHRDRDAACDGGGGAGGGSETDPEGGQPP